METKKNLAKNLAMLRRFKGLSQLELGAKFNYSDKAISKWERADGFPDVLVLNELAKFYGVTLNDLVNSEINIKELVKKPMAKKQMLVSSLSVGLVWFVAVIAFTALVLTTKDATLSANVFLVALPISAVVLVVFSSLWFNVLVRAACVSLLTWSMATTIFVFIKLNFSWLIFVVAGVFQVLVVLWFILKNKKTK